MPFNLGGVFDFLGGDVPEARASGAFPNLPGVGGAVSRELLNRLTQPVTETTRFKTGSAAIRDALSGASQAARQRLGEGAVAGGFLDSGAVARGLTDIDRAELEAFGSALQELILGIDDRTLQPALRFLFGGAQESAQIQGINVGAAVSQRGQNLGFLGDAFRTALQPTDPSSILGRFIA